MRGPNNPSMKHHFKLCFYTSKMNFIPKGTHPLINHVPYKLATPYDQQVNVIKSQYLVKQTNLIGGLFFSSVLHCTISI